MRLDKLLWFLRFARTRGLAQKLTLAGHIRANGRRVERAAHAIAAGDVLTVPVGPRVRVIQVLALPHRRGSAPEARACYRALDEAPEQPFEALLDGGGSFAIAAPDSTGAAQDPQP
jgi:ribosome-associated heat shock protein Hsp15